MLSYLENATVFLLLAFAVWVTIFGFYYSHYKNDKAFSFTYPLVPFGIFVWGDALIWGPFWIGILSFTLYFSDTTFLYLMFSIFWVIRGLGDAIYYFNQQFSNKVLMKPEDLPGYGLVRNTSIWFIYQILLQAITVIAIYSSIHFAIKWFGN